MIWQALFKIVRPRPPWMAGCCLLCSGWVAAASGQDEVVVAGRDASEQSTRRGEVIDYTGEALTLRQENGREARIAASRIISVKTPLKGVFILSHGVV